jgi:hypothetical protein
VGFAMTLLHFQHQSSGKSVSRKVPLDIDFATEKIGKGAFGRTCSLVYSQLKYWWKYAKWEFDGKYWFYKSQRELSDELGMSEKTIWRAIKRLRELGLVLVEKHHQHYWKQVFFYHLCFDNSASHSADGASQPKPNLIPNKAGLKQTSSHPPSRQNASIKHKKTNPLEEIIRRATQHKPNPNGKGFSNVVPMGNNSSSCKVCRGSGLVDNPKNIAIRCNCDSGRRHSNIIPMIGDAKLILCAA